VNDIYKRLKIACSLFICMLILRYICEWLGLTAVMALAAFSLAFLKVNDQYWIESSEREVGETSA